MHTVKTLLSGLPLQVLLRLVRLVGFPSGSDGKKKNPPAMQETEVQSLSWEDPLRREWLPTPVFLPGESHGQRSLEGYRPLGHKELDTTERLSKHAH